PHPGNSRGSLARRYRYRYCSSPERDRKRGPGPGDGTGEIPDDGSEGRGPRQIAASACRSCRARAQSRVRAGRGRIERGGLMSSPSQESFRRHILAIVIASVLLVVGVGGWAASTEFSGAVIAQGQIVVDSNVKKVQHPTGGIIGELRVRDGSHVKAGDVVA